MCVGEGRECVCVCAVVPSLKEATPRPSLPGQYGRQTLNDNRGYTTRRKSTRSVYFHFTMYFEFPFSTSPGVQSDNVAAQTNIGSKKKKSRREKRRQPNAVLATNTKIKGGAVEREDGGDIKK